MNALFMVVGSAVTALLQFVDVPDPVLLLGLGVANLAAAVYFHRTLPDPDQDAEAVPATRAVLRAGE